MNLVILNVYINEQNYKNLAILVSTVYDYVKFFIVEKFNLNLVTLVQH